MLLLSLSALFRFIEDLEIFASWDRNCCSEMSDWLWLELICTSHFFFSISECSPSLKRGSQDLLLLHGVSVTSRGLSMPVELQKSNRLKSRSRCPLKDYNQICVASEPFCYLTLVIITRQSRGRARGNMMLSLWKVLKIRKCFWEILHQIVRKLLSSLDGYITKLSKFILILNCVLGLRNCLEFAEPPPPTCVQKRPRKHGKSLPLFNCKFERKFRKENN